MSKKMTGIEYKQFMKADWDALLELTNAYMDGANVTVDGLSEPEDLDTISDAAKVVIHYGCICAEEDVDMSLEQAYSKWKKAQTHTTFVVQVPNDKVEAVTQYLASVEVKVLK